MAMNIFELTLEVSKFEDEGVAGERRYNLIEIALKQGSSMNQAVLKTWSVSKKSFSANSSYKGRMSVAERQALISRSKDKLLDSKRRFLGKNVFHTTGTYAQIEKALIALSTDSDLLLSHAKSRDLAFTVLGGFKAEASEPAPEVPGDELDDSLAERVEAKAEVGTSSLENWGMF